MNRWLAFASIGFLGLLVLIFFAVWLELPGSTSPKDEETLPSITEPTVTFINPSFGSAEAKVTIVEFGDFQCGACGELQTTLETLQRAFPDDVRVVWKDLPNESIHAMATPAAIAAHCADRQGKFWEYGTELFRRQIVLSEETFPQIARELGLNEQTFKNCYESRDTLPIVKKDYQEGLALGITATPTVFIGSQRFVGAVTLEELSAYVRSLLPTP